MSCSTYQLYYNCFFTRLSFQKDWKRHYLLLAHFPDSYKRESSKIESQLDDRAQKISAEEPVEKHRRKKKEVFISQDRQITLGDKETLNFCSLQYF